MNTDAIAELEQQSSRILLFNTTGIKAYLLAGCCAILLYPALGFDFDIVVGDVKFG